jgi:hypothetical protein
VYAQQVSHLGTDNKKIVSLVLHRCLFIVESPKVASNVQKALYGVKHKRSVLKIVLDKLSLIHRLNFVREYNDVNSRHLIGMRKI